MKTHHTDTHAESDPASRREQRSLPRKRNFFDTRLTARRLRIKSVLALALACVAATAVMSN